jgi:hypothetical protein
MTVVGRATALALFITLILALAPDAGAQNTVLTVTGFPLSVTSTTGADFETGSVSLGTTSFSVNATTNAGFATRTTTVSVRCSAGNCPNTGTLSLTGLQWRRVDQATWNQLTTTVAAVETRQITFNGANDPWGNSIEWRYLLSWTANPPTAMTRFRIRFQLTTTSP